MSKTFKVLLSIAIVICMSVIYIMLHAYSDIQLGNLTASQLNSSDLSYVNFQAQSKFWSNVNLFVDAAGIWVLIILWYVEISTFFKGLVKGFNNV